MAAGTMIGRDRERALLAGALESARSGRTRIVLLHGEPGIGKSTLLESAATQAAESGMAVIWGRCWEAGGAPPYWPFIQLIRGLRKLAPDPPPEIARLLPEAAAAEAHPGNPDDRFLLFDGALRYLAAAAAARPLLLALEDLHAADPASLQLLEFLAAHLRGAPLLLLGTYRDLEARLQPATAASLDRVAREGESVVVEPLQRAEVAQLLAQGPSGADEQTAGWLYEITKGNPLFLREMLHVLVQGGRSPGRPGVPEGVRAAIREHLKALPEALLGPLEAAAVIGRETTPALVASVSGLTLREGEDRLDAAVKLGVLVARGQRFAFAHALIADTLEHGLPPARRAGLHLRIADALDRARVADPLSSLAEIARHLFAAGPVAAERAVAAARAAAEQSLRQLAFEQAESLVSAALDCARDPAIRFELLLVLGQARMSCGLDEEGRAACREAAELARGLGGGERLARAALGYGFAFTFGQTDPVLVDLIEESLRALPAEDSALRARLLGRLAAALQPAANPLEPVRLAREAVAMARRLGGDRTRLEVFHVAGAALARFAPLEERAAIDQEALELALKLGAPVLALRAHARLAFAAWERGRPAAAAEHAAAYEALSRGFRRPRLRWVVPMFSAMRALFEGRLEEHRAHLAEAEQMVAGLEDKLPRLCLTTHRMMTATTVGDDAALAEAFRPFALYDLGPYSACAAALTAARAGRPEEARAALDRVPFATLLGVPDTMLWLWLAEGLHATGDRARAAQLYPVMLPREEENAVVYLHGMAVAGPVALGLSLLASTLGDAQAAQKHAGRALALMREQGGRPFEAQALLRLGELALSRGDAAEGEARFQEARALAAQLGLPLAARIGAAPESAPRMVREGDFWTVAAPEGVLRLKHSRGLEMLARLLAEPGRELRAIDLAGGEDSGDAGEAIDPQARDAYRKRLGELEEELSEAEQWNDSARAARMREEAEALREELGRSIGLGGRARRSASAQERARINVQRRLADALRRIAEGNARLGERLSACVRTGALCSYSPERFRQ